MTADETDSTKRRRSNLPARLNEGWWHSLRLDELVPPALAAWRPLVSDGLAFFLAGLPAHRLTSIMADQLSLPADAAPGQRVTLFFANCPTLHKLGQVLARERSLPMPLRRFLQALESMPPTTSMPKVLAELHAEIGHPPVDFADHALAEGSVAVILPFVYHEQGEARHGVFKVLKPGVEAKLADELNILVELENFLAERGRALGLPALDYPDTLGTVRRLLMKEANFAVEQLNLQVAAAFYADEPRVWVPRLLSWCTPRLTAMERVFGRKVTDAARTPKAARELAGTLVSALLGQPFWSTSEHAIFHADLHAGNLLLADDGRLAILDWSLTARLSKAQRESLMSLVIGGLLLDASRVRAAVAVLGSLSANDTELMGVVEAALDRLVFAGGLPGFDWLLALLDDVVASTNARFPEDFMLFRKTWVSLSGVLGDLDEHISPDSQLFGLGLQRLLAELPARLQAAPNSTNFSTHVANADLMRIFASPALVALRYWMRRKSERSI